MKTEEYIFNGYKATVIIPENFNGKWVWKTEFLYAFDKAEQALVNDGFMRVNYEISDKYGSQNAVRLMHKFHLHLIEKYNLKTKPTLIGYSRGGLYAFNHSLYYPDFVEKVYLDNPVLDFRTWPLHGSIEQMELFEEYGINETILPYYKGNPVFNLEEFFSNNIPVLVVCGLADELVPHSKNSGKLLAYADKNGIKVERVLKPEGKHHPHCLEDVTPILNFIEK